MAIVQPANSSAGVSKRATTAQIAALGIGVVQVAQGGTGASSLGANEVLLGNGTAAVSVVTSDIAGYILTSNGTGLPPTFQGAGGLVSQPGLSVLGVAGVATASPTAIIGTSDQVLMIATGGSALAFGAINLSTAAAVTGILPAALGGLGTSSLTKFTVLLGNGSVTPTQAGPGGAGQLLIGQTVASNPQFQNVGGDLTLSAAGTATIANQAVNFAKFQTVTPLSVVANSSSALTNVVAVTGAAGQVLSINSAGTGMAFSLLSFTTNVTGILPVSQGGIGTSAILANSIVIGNGTSAVSAVTNVTSGYILTSNGPNSVPTFQGAGGLSSQPGLSVIAVAGIATATPTAVLGTIDQVLRIATNGTTLGFGTINLSTSVAVTGILPVGFGGIGASSITANVVLLGNGTSTLSSVVNVTSGYVLTANGTGLAPTFQGAGGLSNQPGLSVLGVGGTSTTTPAAIVGTTNQVLIIAPNGTSLTFGQVNLATATGVTGILAVGNGGHGTSSLTAHGILVGAGTSTVVITAPGRAGQVLIGQSVAADPVFGTIGGDFTLTAGGTATIANNAITYANFQTVGALSVVANASSATTNAAAVSGAANQVLRVDPSGTVLGFGQLNLSSTAAWTGTLSLTSGVTGSLAVSNGGVGTSTLTANAILLGNATAAISAVANVTSGYVLTSNGTGSSPTFQAAAGASGLVLLTSGSVSTATLDIVLTSYTAYRGLVLKLINFLPVTNNAGLYLRVSTNGGSSYDAGAGNYSYASGLVTTGGTPLGDAVSTSAAQIALLTSAIGNGTASGVNCSIEILGQTNTAAWPIVQYDMTFISSDATPLIYRIYGGGIRRAAQDTDAIRILFSSGNIASGTWALYGYS